MIKLPDKTFHLDELLSTLNNTELCDLIHNLLDEKPELLQLVLKWYKEKSGSKVSTNDKLLLEYWKSAGSIISEFNEYGGGSEDDEYEAFGYLDNISELIKEGNISTEAKFEFLDDAFEEYNISNSGFEDELITIFFEICQTREEWEYLVKKLDERPSNNKKELIMTIQRKYLQNEDAYLEERLKNLRSGMDYWDLVKFFTGKGDMQKAVETAEDGIIKGEGRDTELYDFLFDYFAKEGDTANINRIVDTALSRKTEEKNMLDRLFEYYKSHEDYENAKDALCKSFEFIRWNSSYYAEYNRMKNFLKNQDWMSIEPEIFNKIKEIDIHDYLKICLDKNMKSTVMETILGTDRPEKQWQPYKNDFDDFADKLVRDFPEKVIEYYWKKSYKNIQNGNRKTYMVAAAYLGKIKCIYLTFLNSEPDWNIRFSNLKSEFKSRPAFLAEVKFL